MRALPPLIPVQNPCNSPLHPAVNAGLQPDASKEELCVQEAYTPNSQCFGCGARLPDRPHDGCDMHA